ncbi:dGTPase [Kytococcus aerolatus]|uniref:Deoxyguanosinetriphosphate triphosphohydrolase-like protein n=1 Tax=Kytococcus aerolatus TaxID=592308 RepID=A0A212U2U0_9MICO|nr:dGTPase [Kytococcus aerolatus]
MVADRWRARPASGAVRGTVRRVDENQWQERGTGPVRSLAGGVDWVPPSTDAPTGGAGVDSYAVADRERWEPEDPAQKRADRDDFARDRGRVIHSAALRRLSAKTQVMQSGMNDVVRNRLTHSLEVAQIGREMAVSLGCSPDVVDTACLSHDLGHPPFGHNGEDALADLAHDIGGFEGNAQSLRLLTRLEAKRFRADGRSVGLNLTRATLDAVIKYPWVADDGPEGTAKYNAYADDAEVFAWVRRDAPEARRRCLEAQVMDLADDVAYSVHDVEDSITSGHLDVRALHDPAEVAGIAANAARTYAPDLPASVLVGAMEGLTAHGVIPARYDGTRRDQAALKDMTSRLIGHLVQTATDATRAQHEAGHLTRFDADLVIPLQVQAEIAMLKAVAYTYMMNTEHRLELMARQREALQELVAMWTAHPDRLDPQYREDHDAAAAAGDTARARRAVIDQVASLSDGRAWMEHHRWCRHGAGH